MEFDRPTFEEYYCFNSLNQQFFRLPLPPDNYSKVLARNFHALRALHDWSADGLLLVCLLVVSLAKFHTSDAVD